MRIKDRAKREIVKLYLKRYIGRLEAKPRNETPARHEMKRY